MVFKVGKQVTNFLGIVDSRFPDKENLCKDWPNAVPYKSFTGMSAAVMCSECNISFFLKGNLTCSQASSNKAILFANWELSDVDLRGLSPCFPAEWARRS